MRETMFKIPEEETKRREVKFRTYLKENNFDIGIVYFDEFYFTNGRYLSGYWPQVDKGLIFVPQSEKKGCILATGPEGAPYAREMSNIKDICNVQDLMVEEEEYPGAEMTSIKEILTEIENECGQKIERIAVVGYNTMPASIYERTKKDFPKVKLKDATRDFEQFRWIKSDFEIDMIAKAAKIADIGLKTLEENLKANRPEYEVMGICEGEMRKNGAEGFAFGQIVASGSRAKTVIGRATDKVLQKGDFVLVGLSPRYNGYACPVARPLIVESEGTPEQRDILKIALEAYNLAIDVLKPGIKGKDVDLKARKYLKNKGLDKYHLYGSCHSVGLWEYERPFFGPTSEIMVKPNMVVAIDVSLIGHPIVPGVRYEEAFLVTETGKKALSQYMRSIYG